ncbi:hypothetical protein PVAP13_1KG086254 [Panicum virgatum]|uniref:Uncharacterized protein n=1 Tax=Panicum virgatum TaxID=38727 RepID=A0A8T0XBP8_PANVG|nr:hypothetical protein PVAP13_1KG086254 [Panicum virgatum]
MTSAPAPLSGSPTRIKCCVGLFLLLEGIVVLGLGNSEQSCRGWQTPSWLPRALSSLCVGPPRYSPRRVHRLGSSSPYLERALLYTCLGYTSTDTPTEAPGSAGQFH